MPSMKILDYTIRSAPGNAHNAAQSVVDNVPNYATKEELDALYGQIQALKNELESLTPKRPVTTRKKEAGVDE